MSLFSCFFVFLLIIVAVNAHSWVQCADYAEENGRDWDVSKCRAYPRDYVNKFMYGGYVFGADVGMNHQPGETNVCQSSFSGNSYTSTYPSAKYNPGQRVCLAWPPKNHVSAKCSNPYIPDSGTKIYRSAVNPVGDPSLSQFRQNLVHDFGANTVAGAGVGYQNCPKFCTNNDKALCTGCFNIPSNLAVGKYTFMWAWSFNSVSDLYSTCFDVEIVANSGNNVTTLPFVGPDDFVSSTTSSPSTSSASASISTTSASSTTTSSSSITTSSSSSSSSPTSSSSGYGSTATSSLPSTTSSSSSSSSSGPCSPSTTSRPSSTTHYSTTSSSSCSCPDVCVNNTPCDIGSERCLCTKGGACDAGLTCASGVCVDLATICV